MRYVVKGVSVTKIFSLCNIPEAWHISHTDSRNPPHKNRWEVTLLSRYAIKVFFVSLGFLACRPDDAVFVVRRTIDSVQL